MEKINLEKIWASILQYKIPVIIISLGIILVLSSAGLFLMSPLKGNTDNGMTSSESESSDTGLSESITESQTEVDSESSYDYSVDSSEDNSSESSQSDISSKPEISPTSEPVKSPTPVPTEIIRGKNLVTWTPASGTKSNNTYEVFVRESGQTGWTQLFVYNIKIGHQEGNDPLRALVGMTYSGPEDAPMVVFDFNGKVDFKITYKNGVLNKVNLSPESYGIKHTKEANTIYFSISQDKSSPRKILLRPNDNWRTEVLHIMTNPIQEKVPDKNSPEVFVIKPGDRIPRVLPRGKRIYYFEKGTHVLPRGAWVEYDLGRAIDINKFDLISGSDRPFLVPGAQKFRIEYKLNLNDEYKVCYENLSNTSLDIRGTQFTSVKARYVRLVLLGNNAVKTEGGYNYLHSSHIKEFRVYERGTNNNVVLNKAIDGSSAAYPIASNGNDSSLSYFGHIYAGESFFIPRSNYEVYLDYGSVLKGAINSDWQSDVKIYGRGIMDGSDLVHNPANKYAEGRTSAIRAQYADNILIEGITFLDYPMWGIITNHSINPIVRNIHYFGSVVNSDGVHMSGVTNGLLEGSFFRTCDDTFVMYHYGPADNIRVRNSVFFTDGGRVALIGMSNDRGDIRNVTFENNDILNVQNVWNLYVHGGTFSIWASGGNTIENIFFRNIRIEKFREPDIVSFFQFKTINDSHGWGAGKINNIVMENIDYRGGGKALSYALGENDEFAVRNLTFRNVKIDGVKMTENFKPNIEIQNFVYNVKYE